jgi:hypothetical protein
MYPTVSHSAKNFSEIPMKDLLLDIENGAMELTKRET